MITARWEGNDLIEITVFLSLVHATPQAEGGVMGIFEYFSPLPNKQCVRLVDYEWMNEWMNELTDGKSGVQGCVAPD